MPEKPTYDELKCRVLELERTIRKLELADKSGRHEKTSTDSERKYEKIIANIPGVAYQFIASRDYSYKVEFIDRKKLKATFGFEPDPGTSFDAFLEHIPDDEKERFLNSIREAVERVEPWNYEGRFIKPGGETIWFSGTAVPRVEGEFIVFFGMLLDISRRKQMEDSLRMTQFCFESAAVGIYHIQADGQILNLNTHAAGMLGYTVEELSGSFIWDIDPSAHPDTFDEGWRRLVAAGVAIFEVTHIRKDGCRIPVEVTSKLLEYDGRQFLICFAQDITQRKQVENEREKLLNELQKALENVKTLSGLLPICASCKKIRDDKGYWNQIEHYIHAHSEAKFSHGICPDCVKELYPSYDISGD